MFIFSPLLLLAFGFANLAILGWLAAAAAPIIIHLWMRQTHKTTRWAAIRFLQAALERQARRLQLQHWLLLAIRTAILLLIVLAAAKPFFDRGLMGSNDQPTHRIMLFDTSLSMSHANDQGIARIERAKDLARALIEEGSLSDRYTLMSISSASSLELGQVALDRQAALSAIKRIEPTLGTASPIVGFTAVKRLLSQQTSNSTVPERSEVLFFSDMSKHSWSDFVASTSAGETTNASGTAASDSAVGDSASIDSTALTITAIEPGPTDLLEQLAEETTLTVVDMASSKASQSIGNRTITSLSLNEPLATSGRELELRAEITSYGNLTEAAEPTTVELVADGVVLKSEKVRLVANASTLVDFPVQFDTEGSHSLSIRIQDEDFTEDNERWLALNLKKEVRILCVEGSRGASQHVADSLNPSGKKESALQPEIVTDADVSGIDLTRFDCVIFCNVAEFGSNEAEQIKRYVEAGGGAIFFLGDQIKPDRYRGILSAEPSRLTLSNPTDRVLEASMIRPVAFEADSKAVPERVSETGVVADELTSDISLLPFLIGTPITNPSFGLDPLDYAHPIVAPFLGRERAGLLTTTVSRYHPLELTDSSHERGTQVALALKGGDPLIITSRFGQGRTAVVATAASLKSIDPETGEVWTAMPAWPSFLPLVRGMVQSVVADSSQAASYLIGESFGNPRLMVSNQLLVTRPDEGEETIGINADQAWSYSRTDQAGIYQVDNTWSVAVNLDPQESDFTRVAIDTLMPQLTVRSATTATQRVVEAFGGNLGLHRTLLLLALALVLIESVIACWFGRGSA